MKKTRLKRNPPSLKKKCWKWFSKWWHLKHRGHKSVLSNSFDIVPGHVIPKCRGLIYWFMESDIFPQTSGENLRHNFDPTDYFRWYINKFGQKKFDRLASFNKRLKPYINFEGRIERYKRKIEELEQ